jgi:hypothetical protein
MTENKLPEVGQEYRDKNKTISVDRITISNKGTRIEYDKCFSIDVKNFWNEFEELPDQPTSAKSAQVGSEKVEGAARELSNVLGWKSELVGQGVLTETLIECAVNLVNVLEEYFIKCRGDGDNEAGVQEAMENAKERLKEYADPGCLPYEYELAQALEDIVSSLEEQKAANTSKESENMHTKEEHVQETDVKAEPEEETIWKRANDLPTKDCNVCIELLDGTLKYCKFVLKLSDFPYPFTTVRRYKVLSPEEEPAISKMETTESIWKPISDLPEEEPYVLLETIEGMDYARYNLADKKFEGLNGSYYVDSFIKEYCTLTDFVNQHKTIAKNQDIIFAEIAKLKNK